MCPGPRLSQPSPIGYPRSWDSLLPGSFSSWRRRTTQLSCVNLSSVFRRTLDSLGSRIECLAIYVVPAGLPSGRLALQRALGAAWGMFPFVNWHRQLSTLHSCWDHSLLCSRWIQWGSFSVRSRKPLCWGRPAPCVYSRSELFRPATPSVS